MQMRLSSPHRHSSRGKYPARYSTGSPHASASSSGRPSPLER
jgi:hypothetical protein